MRNFCYVRHKSPDGAILEMKRNRVLMALQIFKSKSRSLYFWILWQYFGGGILDKVAKKFWPNKNCPDFFIFADFLDSFLNFLDLFLKVTQLQHPKGAKDRVKSLNFICSYFHLLSIDLSNHSLLHPAFSHLAQIGLLLLHLHNLNA